MVKPKFVFHNVIVPRWEAVERACTLHLALTGKVGKAFLTPEIIQEIQGLNSANPASQSLAGIVEHHFFTLNRDKIREIKDNAFAAIGFTKGREIRDAVIAIAKRSLFSAVKDPNRPFQGDTNASRQEMLGWVNDKTRYIFLDVMSEMPDQEVYQMLTMGDYDYRVGCYIRSFLSDDEMFELASYEAGHSGTKGPVPIDPKKVSVSQLGQIMAAETGEGAQSKLDQGSPVRWSKGDNYRQGFVRPNDPSKG